MNPQDTVPQDQMAAANPIRVTSEQVVERVDVLAEGLRLKREKEALFEPLYMMIARLCGAVQGLTEALIEQDIAPNSCAHIKRLATEAEALGEKASALDDEDIALRRPVDSNTTFEGCDTRNYVRGIK